MDILGVGPLELFFIALLALIILGPKDIVKTGKTVGRFLRKVVTSPSWQTVQRTRQELKYLPNRLIREAELEDSLKEIQKTMNINSYLPTEQSILPPSVPQEPPVSTQETADGDISAWITPPAGQEQPTDADRQPD